MSDRAERIARANAQRRALQAAHPGQFNIGVTSGMKGEVAPPEFTLWSASQRDAYFAGAYIGISRRREAESEAAA